MRVLISNEKRFEKIKLKIKKDGLSKLHVVSDFDRTLTYGKVNGRKIPSLISILRDENYLSEEYSKKAKELFEKYHPTETDTSIDVKEKKKLMQKWWEEHYKILIEYGVRKSHLKEIINSGWIKFRNGVDEFLEFLHNHDIPLVIMSADGCGEAIPMFFEKNNKNYSNIYYIVNRFIWSKDGKAIGVKKPVIHSMNKDEMILRKMPEIYISIKNRRNIILLGDSLSDIGMVKGFRYKNLMKIGFLNFEEDRLRGEYAKSFDVVIEGDGDFGFVNKIIKSLAD